MRAKLRTKLVALLVAASVATLISAVVAFVSTDERTSAAAKESSSAILARAVGTALGGAVAFDDQASSEKVLHTFAAEPTARLAVVFRADGTALGQWTRAGVVVPAVVPAAGYADDKDGKTLWVKQELRGDDGAVIGTLAAAFSTDDLRAKTAAIYRLAAWVMAGCVAAALALALRMHRVVTVPLQSLADVAGAVGKRKDYSLRAQVNSGDEIELVAHAFNEMLHGIQERDRELEGHRKNLEALVDDRTRALDQRNRSMRIVLDNVAQGIVAVDRDGVLDSERSAAFDAWFGVPQARTLTEHLETHDARAASWFKLGLEMVFEDMMPLSVALGQMPAALAVGARHYRMQYQPVFFAGREGEDSATAVDKLLVLFVDVTADVERERVEQGQREAFHIFNRLMSDKAGLLDFADEAQALTSALVEPDVPKEIMMRAVHTLKGNAGLFDLSSIASLCHTYETRMVDEGTPLAKAEIELLRGRVDSVVERIKSLSGQRKGQLDIAESDLEALRAAVAARAPAEIILAMIATWTWQPARPRFEQYATQAQALAERLGKGDIVVDVDVDDARLPPEQLRSFLSALAHVVRNAVDHGLESPDERVAAGKPARGHMRLAAHRDEGDLVIEVGDDGRGIDWAAVERKAKAAGLPSSSAAELQAALFADGLSTRDEASETSGRGVGMAVVKSTVDDLGGRIEIVSRPREGTTWRFVLPVAPRTMKRAA